MVNVAAPARDPLVLRLLSKLGSFVAMIVVLAVIGLAIFKVSGTSEQPDRQSAVNRLTLSRRYRKSIGKGMQTFVHNGTSDDDPGD